VRPKGCSDCRRAGIYGLKRGLAERSRRYESSLKHPFFTKVKTKNGVVTLGGKAKNAAVKELATKFANDVRGVKRVNNLMTIE